MPTIDRYAQTVIKQRAVPNTVNPQAIQDAGADFGYIADLTGGIAEKINEQQQIKQTRYETIQRARLNSAYMQDAETLFTKFSQENDLTDPNSAKNFNQMLRKKMGEYVAMHDGGADSKARLELQLTGLQDSFTARMAETATGAQKKFIQDQIGSHIDRIAAETYSNPSNIEAGFKQLNGLMYEYGPAIDTEDELRLLANAQSMVVEGAVNSFLDSGDYDGAKKLIDDNYRYFETMPARQQMSILGRVNAGIAAQEKQKNEIRNKMASIKSAADAAGIEITPTKLFSAATGISETSTPQDKVAVFQSTTGLSDQQMTPAIIAKIGFGVDLPGAGEIDMNKERLPDGGYTPKGIGAVIKPAYDNAASTKVQVDKVILQADTFTDSENKQAGLAAMIAFQKLIDDGAAVREGDIKLSAQGNSAFDNMKLMYDRIGKGSIATPKQIQEMKESARVFGDAVLEAARTYIDPYLREAEERGYRQIDIGLPREAYDRVFGKTKTSEDKFQRNKQIEDKAKAYGMSVSEYLGATAKKHNKTVKEIADQIGYTGNLE